MLKSLNNVKVSKPLEDGVHIATIKSATEDNNRVTITYLIDGAEYNSYLNAELKEGKTTTQLHIWAEALATYHWDDDMNVALTHIIDTKLTLAVEKKGKFIDLLKNTIKPDKPKVTVEYVKPERKSRE